MGVNYQAPANKITIIELAPMKTTTLLKPGPLYGATNLP